MYFNILYVIESKLLEFFDISEQKLEQSIRIIYRTFDN